MALNNLIRDLKNFKSKCKSQAFIMSWLNDRMSGIGIKMQYDEYSNDSNYISENKDFNEETPTYQMVDGELVVYHTDESLKERAPPIDGNFSYLETNDSFVKRVILSHQRGYDYGESPLCVECNGLILDAEEWNIIAKPPRAFSKCNVEYVNTELAEDNYEFLKIVDGTMVTLYNWEHPTDGPIWCISTSNGYDVSHLKWMGPLTYAELLFNTLKKVDGLAELHGMELVRDKLCPGDTRLSFTELDPDKSYSLTIRTHYYHPLMVDPEGIWTIQTYNRKTNQTDPDGLVGVKPQKIYSREDMTKMIGRTIGDKNKIEVVDLAKINNSALAYITDNSESPENVEVAKINYGFILRSTKANVNGCFKDVLVDSDLLKQIRQMMYKYPNKIVRDSLNASNRMNYFIMKAYLVPPDHRKFLSLFPYYKYKFDEFDIIMKMVISHILYVQQKKMMNSDDADQIINPKLKIINMVSRTLLEHIVKNIPDFNPINANAQQIVREYIIKTEYAMIFIKLVSA